MTHHDDGHQLLKDLLLLEIADAWGYNERDLACKSLRPAQDDGLPSDCQK